jgi:predicted DCC family thiol-disulfide oxidoreductase YuxK
VENDQNILFYDGPCGLCQGAVKFVLRWEKKEAQSQTPLFFAELQSPSFRDLLNDQLPDPLPDSIIYLHHGKVFTKSRAVFMLASRLIFPFSLLAVFQYLPSGLFDWIYDGIARIRNQWPRHQALCEIIPAEWKKRLLV